MKTGAGRGIGRWVWLVALGAGCSTPTGDAPAGQGLTRSTAFALHAPTLSPTLTAAGAGVSVRWGDLAQRVESGGLGGVIDARAAGDGAVDLTYAGGVEERWVTDGASAEQSWTYPARPTRDRVAVTVTLAGARLEREGADGLWLRAQTGELLRYGHATWVDAEGRRTAVPSRWEGDHVAIEVPPAVVASSAYPAVLDPSITPAFALQPAEERSQMPSTATLARTATGSLLFLPLQRQNGLRSDAPLMVQRFDAAQNPVAGSFRAVLPATPSRYRVVTAGGRVWLIWQDGARVLGQRFGADGAALDAAPVVLSASFGFDEVACNATACMMIGGGNGLIQVARFSLAGAPLDASPVTVRTSTITDRTLAALDERFVLAWSEPVAGAGSEVFVARVGNDGVVQDPGGRLISAAGANRRTPRLASSGTTALLGFNADASGPRPAGVYLLALDRDLNPLSPLTVVSGLISRVRSVERLKAAGDPWSTPTG